MTDSKRSQGLETPKRAVAQARRKVADLAGVFRPKPKDDLLPEGPSDKKTLTGRAASRAAKYGKGYEKPWRSRMQRARRRPRTGGWK